MIGAPQVSRPARDPHVHFRVRTAVAVTEAEHARLVVMRLQHSIDQRARLQRDHIDGDADLLQIVLNDRHHLDAFGVARVRDDAESNGVASFVDEGAIGFPREAI